MVDTNVRNNGKFWVIRQNRSGVNYYYDGFDLENSDKIQAIKFFDSESACKVIRNALSSHGVAVQE